LLLNKDILHRNKGCKNDLWKNCCSFFILSF
jgi:hypothetical protein